MQQQSSVALRDEFSNPDRKHKDYLSYKQIEEQYPGTVQAETLSVWACKRRYGFHFLITKIGRKPRVRRDRWEQFLDSRTIGADIKVEG